MKSIHPFPARMAPEIALNSLKELSKKAVVLDPMTGSGTVLRQAVLSGHKAIGFDMDPLAVMMSKAATQNIDFELLDELCNCLVDKAKRIDSKKAKLPWIENDQETQHFIRYWFALPQRKILQRIAYVLHTSKKLRAHPTETNLLRIALSRLIVTKKRGASLAWDVSHSRPHKVRETNDFDVWEGYERAYLHLKNTLIEQKISGSSEIYLGDARNMVPVSSRSIDAVITSPPYLNAIDYLRGHKLSLVWFGYTIGQIRGIRSECIGVERRLLGGGNAQVMKIVGTLNGVEGLPSRDIRMIERYTMDACVLMEEIARVLKLNGKAIFVIGNSCLKNIFVENSKIFTEAAKLHNLHLKHTQERELPIGSRYLPLPKDGSNALGKRMKTEVILEFARY